MCNKKGFTLMEMLIVVAIIAILIAISIPIFSNKIEIAREVVDLANCRAAYSELASYVLLNEDPTTSGHFEKVTDSTTGHTIYRTFVKCKSTQEGWQTKNLRTYDKGVHCDVAGLMVVAPDIKKNWMKVQYDVDTGTFKFERQDSNKTISSKAKYN